MATKALPSAKRLLSPADTREDARAETDVQGVLHSVQALHTHHKRQSLGEYVEALSPLDLQRFPLHTHHNPRSEKVWPVWENQPPLEAWECQALCRCR